MINNLYFLITLAFFVFFLTIVIGAIASIFINNRSLRVITTMIMTALATFLILWTNIRIAGKVVWFSSPADISSSNSPTADISDS